MDIITPLERVLVDVKDVAAEGVNRPQLRDRDRAARDLALTAARVLTAHLAADQEPPPQPAFGPYWLCVRAAGGALVICSRFHPAIVAAAANCKRSPLRVAATVMEADPQIIAPTQINASALAAALASTCQLLNQEDWPEHPQSGDALGAIATAMAAAATGLACKHQRLEL